jgi:hypothetical protein
VRLDVDEVAAILDVGLAHVAIPRIVNPHELSTADAAHPDHGVLDTAGDRSSTLVLS